MNLSIIIPCFNEVENVDKLKDEFLPVVVQMLATGTTGSLTTKAIEVIFVDDGSRDGTLVALQSTFASVAVPGLSFQFIQHHQNQGLGAALRTGFDLARGAVLLTTDCDGTYHFSEIPALLTRLTPEIDIVTASPYHPQGAVAGVPAYRLLLSRGSSAIYRVVASRQVYTYTALFRAYRREVIECVPFYASGFLAGTELLVNGLRMGYRVAEHPTVLHARVFGVSKAKIVRTMKAHLRFQLRTLLPWHPYGLLLRGDDDTIYLYEAGQKRAFVSPESFLSHGYQWQQVLQVNQKALAAIPNGPEMSFRDGTLLRGSEETVYFIEHGYKRPFVSAASFEALGYRWFNVLQVTDHCLQAIESGCPLTGEQPHPDGTLVRGEGEAIYLIKAGKRCLVPNVRIFRSWGYRWEQVVQVREEQLARYPLGEVIVAQATLFQHRRQHSWKAFLTPVQAITA